MPGPHQNSLHITQLNYAFHFLPELWLIHVAYNALNDLTFEQGDQTSQSYSTSILNVPWKDLS